MAKIIDMSNECVVIGCKRKKAKQNIVCTAHSKDLNAGMQLRHYLGGWIKVKMEANHE